MFVRERLCRFGADRSILQRNNLSFATLLIAFVLRLNKATQALGHMIVDLLPFSVLHGALIYQPFVTANQPYRGADKEGTTS